MKLHGLAKPHFALVTLGQPEVDVHAADVFQVDQVGAVLDEITEVHIAHADGAVEGGQDRHARKARAGQCQLGFSHLQIGGAFFQYTLRHKTLRDQFLVALEIRLGNRHLGLGLLDLGSLQRVVELHQQLAPAHSGPIGKPEILHASWHLRSHHHALARPQGTNRLCVILQRHALDTRDLDPRGARCRRRSSGWHRTAALAGRGRRAYYFLRPLRLGLVPPCGTRRRRDSNHRDNGINNFGSH